MARSRIPTEFGFTTGPFIAPEHARPVWRTLLFGALLSLIPLVGPALSAVYIDRRQTPSTYDPLDALQTALLQLAALVLLGVLFWIVFGLVLGVSVQLHPQVTGPAV